MGWTALHKPDTQSVEDLLREEIAYPILDIEIDGWAHVAYAAVQYESRIGALVILLETSGKFPAGMNFAYKIMSEEEGPFYRDCPARILGQLSPTSEPGAIMWRMECRGRLLRLKGCE